MSHMAKSDLKIFCYFLPKNIQFIKPIQTKILIKNDDFHQKRVRNNLETFSFEDNEISKGMKNYNRPAD